MDIGSHSVCADHPGLAHIPALGAEAEPALFRPNALGRGREVKEEQSGRQKHEMSTGGSLIIQVVSVEPMLAVQV